MSTYPEKPLRCVIPPPPPQSIEDKIKEQQLLLLTKQVEYYCLKIEQLKGGVMSDKPKESAIEPIGEPCQVKSDAFCLVEFTDTDKYLARISNNPVGWIDELHIYATSNQSAIDTLTAENKRLREYLDRIFDGFGTLSRYELEELIRELKDETKGE